MFYSFRVREEYWFYNDLLLVFCNNFRFQGDFFLCNPIENRMHFLNELSNYYCFQVYIYTPNSNSNNNYNNNSTSYLYTFKWFIHLASNLFFFLYNIQLINWMSKFHCNNTNVKFNDYKKKKRKKKKNQWYKT